MIRFPLLLPAALALCLCSLPAAADSTLFSDLGPSDSAYGTADGSIVAGSGSYFGSSYMPADPFTVAGSGSEAVSEIDLAVGWQGAGLNTFYASIWSDVSGAPGSQIADAYWSLSDSNTFDEGNCCSLVSVTGISGVTLTGGTQYFMVLGPLSTTDSSAMGWWFNNQGVTGNNLYSANAGATWMVSNDTPGAFDVLSGTSSPEPSTLALLAAGTAFILIKSASPSN